MHCLLKIFEVGVLLVISTSVIGCGESVGNSSNLSVSGGRLVGRSSSSVMRRSTLALSTQSLKAEGRSFCSAVLIADHIALTAAHCVMSDRRMFTADKVIAVGGIDVKKNEAIRVRSIVVHRAYQPEALLRDDLGPMHDIALLHLSEIKDKQLKPTPLARHDLSIGIGAKIKIAGYGVTQSRQDDDTGSLRHVGMRLNAVDMQKKVLLLKGPLRSGFGREPSISGRERIVRVRAGACAGDSGGPAYLDSMGEFQVVGVTSFGKELPSLNAGDDREICVGENGYTDVRAYAAPLRLVIAKLNKLEHPQSHYWFDSKGQLIAAE